MLRKVTRNEKACPVMHNRRASVINKQPLGHCYYSVSNCYNGNNKCECCCYNCIDAKSKEKSEGNITTNIITEPLPEHCCIVLGCNIGEHGKCNCGVCTKDRLTMAAKKPNKPQPNQQHNTELDKLRSKFLGIDYTIEGDDVVCTLKMTGKEVHRFPVSKLKDNKDEPISPTSKGVCTCGNWGYTYTHNHCVFCKLNNKPEPNSPRAIEKKELDAEYSSNDYNECNTCGFDHAYAPTQAYKAHTDIALTTITTKLIEFANQIHAVRLSSGVVHSCMRDVVRTSFLIIDPNFDITI